MKLALRNVRLPLSEFLLEVDAEMTAARTAIFGPSGAGKTSLLEIIAGLRDARCDLIRFNDVTFAEASSALPVRQRRVGYVPQDDSLFPHLDVRRTSPVFCRSEVCSSAMSASCHAGNASGLRLGARSCLNRGCSCSTSL